MCQMIEDFKISLIEDGKSTKTIERWNHGKHKGWYKRADHPKNPGNLDPLDDIGTYEIINIYYVYNLFMVALI